jgi:hypothetical protein
MDVWLDGGWMGGGRMAGWMKKLVGWTAGLMDRFTDVWTTNRWMDRWMDVCIDG